MAAVVIELQKDSECLRAAPDEECDKVVVSFNMMRPKISFAYCSFGKKSKFYDVHETFTIRSNFIMTA